MDSFALLISLDTWYFSVSCSIVSWRKWRVPSIMLGRFLRIKIYNCTWSQFPCLRPLGKSLTVGWQCSAGAKLTYYLHTIHKFNSWQSKAHVESRMPWSYKDMGILLYVVQSSWGNMFWSKIVVYVEAARSFNCNLLRFSYQIKVAILHRRTWHLLHQAKSVLLGPYYSSFWDRSGSSLLNTRLATHCWFKGVIAYFPHPELKMISLCDHSNLNQFHFVFLERRKKDCVWSNHH